MGLEMLELLIATYREAGTSNPLVALKRRLSDPRKVELLRALVARAPRAKLLAWRAAMLGHQACSDEFGT